MLYFRITICVKTWKCGNRYKKSLKVIYRVNSSLKGDIKVIEIFWKLQNLALKLRKRLFGSEYVFKIEYLNGKRVEGVEILHNIITYTKCKNVFKMILQNMSILKTLKQRPLKNVTLYRRCKMSCTIKFICKKVT